ncbi:MAG: phenylalanine--tRNA ligase subunit beta, partial [Erysipelotrichaceae bacterium]|nr:phenylalanine--tRNA ligase subunit beta [Erysipelotrichaceae bacterium]
MRITYNWLKQYMDLSDVSPEMLAEKLTRGGLEVEGMEKMAQGTNLIIGQVLSCVAHPNSDHLHVCQVDTGDSVRQIVCGAPNVAAGQKVIVALPGCVLPGGEIKSGAVRGEASDGMICALFELGVDRKQLTEQQLAGIEVLPEDAPVGNRNVLEYLGLDDIIYDVSLTPNRADCLSVWALAKEVGAMLNKPVDLPDYHYECQEIPTDLIIRSETEKCPLFWGKVINKVVIKPSPKWLVQALHGAGIKAINNVVDISNYVMLETGQPLHFYDLAKIPGKEITVRQGLRETYTALDGIEYPIYEDDIMITNQGKAIGIAGIMGGDDSKIDEETHGIIIEAAHFNNVCIRNTSRRLDLNTEAATRFIKGLDPLGGRKAVERSVQLLLELADADGIEETVLCGSEGYEPLALDASVSRINKLLGTQFGYEAVKSAFERLDFQPEKVDEDTIRCHIPSYRRDITCWQDLSEETVRLLGYENIRSTLPLMPTVQGGLPPYKRKKRVLQQMLNGFGLSEIISYSLVSRQKI